MRKVTKSCLTGFGSKYRACKECGIHEFIPPLTNNKQIYVEPFIFSAVMFFNIKCRSAILNDKFDLVYNFWKVIKEQCPEFEKEIEYVWIGKKWFDEYAQRTDPIGKAVYFYLMNQSSHKGIMEKTFRYKAFNHPFTKNFDIWSKKMNEMASLTLWDLDFREIYHKLKDNGSEGYNFTWYIDPPYYEVGRYVLNFSEQDHVDLFNLNQELKDNIYHHLIISYNDCEFIRNLYKNWNILEVSWEVGSHDSKSNIYKELLISNRPLKRYLSNTTKVQSDFLNLVKNKK